MACLGSRNGVSDHEVLLTNHIGGNVAIAVQPDAFVTGDVSSVQVPQPAAMAADQNLDDQFPGDNTAVADVEAQLSVVPNQSDPIWWLRFFAASTLFCATMVGGLYLPGDLHRVRTAYRVSLALIFICSLGVPS